MTFKLLTGIVVALATHWAHAQVCERAQINGNLRLSEVIGEAVESGFQLSWSPIKGATHYELKILLRVPEGRVLAQSDATLTTPFFTLGPQQWAGVQVVQLVTELVAFCDTSQSETAHAQLVLHKPESGCRFVPKGPVLKKESLSWLPVKGAHSYQVCQFKENDGAACHETTDAQNTLRRDTLATTRLVSITPVCGQGSGLPHFIAVNP